MNFFYKIIKKKIEELIRGSKSGSASIDLLYYHLQKVGLKRSRSYIDSPEWLKNKKATINRKSNDENCFQDALTVALNHQNIEKKKTVKRHRKFNLLLISIIGKKLDFPSHSKDWKKFEQNNYLLIYYLYHQY